MFRILLILMILLGGLVVPMSLPQPVYAATQDLSVTGEGDQTSGTYAGGATDYTNLNSDDGDTSYARWRTIGTQYHCRQFSNFSTSAQSIEGVKQWYKWQNDVGYNGFFVTDYCRIGGANYYGDTTYADSATYSWNYYDWAINPATEAAWTATALNSAQFGYKIVLGTGYVDYFKITKTYLTVTYTPITVPTVSTSAASSISYNGTHLTAILNGSVDDDGGANITERGFAWGTTSNSTNPGNQVPSASYTDNWTEYDADWGEGDFSHQITGLNLCDIYYYRAYALNSEGWGWGDEQSFTTLCDPDIEVKAASLVSAHNVRINALIQDDGGQACDVRFAYGTSSGNCTDGALGCPGATCNTSTYDTATAWVSGYTTGQIPYVDISGLLANMTYYYCVQISNDLSCRCGGELSFHTTTGVFTPTEFVSSPTSSTISLLWVKGVGASNTLVRVSTATYPTLVTEGTAIYVLTGNSYLYSGLTPGTTYYFSAWGLSDSTYSHPSYAITMATTLAAGAADVTLPTPPTPTEWSQEPSVAGITDLPFYPLANYFADEYSLPRTTMWYGLCIMFSIGAGFFFYWRGNKNLLAGMAVVAIGLCISASLGLVMLWLGVFFIVIAISMGWMTQRF